MSVPERASCGRARAMSGRGSGDPAAAAGRPLPAGPSFARADASSDRTGARIVRPHGRVCAAAPSAAARGVSKGRKGALIGGAARDTNRRAANLEIAVSQIASRGR